MLIVADRCACHRAGDRADVAVDRARLPSLYSAALDVEAWTAEERGMAAAEAFRILRRANATMGEELKSDASLDADTLEGLLRTQLQAELSIDRIDLNAPPPPFAMLDVPFVLGALAGLRTETTDVGALRSELGDKLGRLRGETLRRAVKMIRRAMPTLAVRCDDVLEVPIAALEDDLVVRLCEMLGIGPRRACATHQVVDECAVERLFPRETSFIRVYEFAETRLIAQAGSWRRASSRRSARRDRRCIYVAHGRRSPRPRA